jgi:hypothetical protein
MSPALIAAPVLAQWGGKERRPSCWCRALTVKLRPENRLSAVLAGVRHSHR